MEGVPLCQQKSVGGDLFTPEIFNKKALFRMFLLVTEARQLHVVTRIRTYRQEVSRSG